MSKYVEYTFELSPFEPWNEVLVAYLADVDFESFQENENKVLAYIQQDVLVEEKVNQILKEVQSQGLKLKFEKKEIEEENWNAVWESQFEPVYVDDRLLIKAPFHEVSNFQGMTVVIEPRMSFGTGHHQTTYLMCSSMMKENLQGKKVLDMGAGTGVLAILAEKLGASEITAIEIEPWSAENCAFNATNNECQKVTSIEGGAEKIEGKFDHILANINKNILKSQLEIYANSLNDNGLLYISGFFTSDNDELIEAATAQNLRFIASNEKEGWSMLSFQK